MKKHSLLWSIFLGVVFVEVFSLLPAKPSSPNQVSGTDSKAQQWVQGIIHVHSTFSDGGGTPEQIAEAAQRAGQDFVILTDHNNYEARKRGFEKSFGGTDLLVEMETSLMIGHAISFFSLSDRLRNADNESIIQATYREFMKTEEVPNAFISIAHPSNMKNPWARLDDFAAGWEVINFDSSWQRQLAEQPFQFLVTVGLLPLNEYLAALRFFATYPKDFVAWDEMTVRGPGHFAYLAHDTHSKLKINSQKAINWPGYLQTFKMASNILFLQGPKSSDFETRKKQYYQSLREGRLAIVFQAVAPFVGNDWKVVCGEDTYKVGDIAKLKGTCEAIITTPSTAFKKVARLVKNGEIISEVLVDRNSTAPLKVSLKSPGTYRLEILAKKRSALGLLLNRLVPYVYYNPIYVQ